VVNDVAVRGGQDVGVGLGLERGLGGFVLLQRVQVL